MKKGELLYGWGNEHLTEWTFLVEDDTINVFEERFWDSFKEKLKERNKIHILYHGFIRHPTYVYVRKNKFGECVVVGSNDKIHERKNFIESVNHRIIEKGFDDIDRVLKK